MNLKADILAALKAATEPMDRTAIAQLCLSGTDKQVADHLYLLKKDGAIIGDKQRGGSFLYRMPNASDAAPLPVELSARMAEEVDEIEMESIEAAALHRVLIEDHFPDAGKMIAVKVPSDDVLEEPVENGKQYMDVWPGPTLAERMADPKGTKPGSQLESAVQSVRGEAEVEALHSDLIKEQFPELNAKQPERAVSETVEDETEEPIEQEVPSFRVGVYSDGTMVLEKPHGGLFELDKAQFAVLAEFARTVGWLPA